MLALQVGNETLTAYKALGFGLYLAANGFAQRTWTVSGGIGSPTSLSALESWTAIIIHQLAARPAGTSPGYNLFWSVSPSEVVQMLRYCD
jgi:hypothetical protein